MPINERNWQTVRRLMREINAVRIEVGFLVLPTVKR